MPKWINSVERMRDKKVLVVPNGCWEWQGKKGKNGYGHTTINGVFWSVHRIFHVHYNGEIPDGYQVDHLCGNRACCNPQHLEAVPPAVNNLRSASPSALNSRRTTCIRGHALSDSNLYITPDGRRMCKTCNAARNAASYAKRRASCLECQ